MEWITCIKRALDYMERNLLTIQCTEEVAENAYISLMYLQKGFQIMTGYTLAEYIRNRRLYLAALDLVNTDDKIIDIALRYGYETPESFTKAFTRFHQNTPSEVKKLGKIPRIFLPLTIKIAIQGGDKMDYTVEKVEAFKVIGFEREFDCDTAQKLIPLFWDEVFRTYAKSLMAGKAPETEIEKAIAENHIGEFGICLDNIGKDGKFLYVVGGKYLGGPVPEGLKVYDVPEHTGARFNCIGPIPGALQSMNNRIWNEWLPGNTEYELDQSFTIEWYSSEGTTKDADYRTYIEIPVKKL